MPISSTLRYIGHRLWQEYLMPERTAELVEQLQQVQACGYQFHDVLNFSRLAVSGQAVTGKHCVLRVDVDSDPAYCRVLADKFSLLGIPATFYFRLCTTDPAIIKEMSARGFEVGYHFEEIATYAKKNGVRVRAEALENLAQPRSRFIENYRHFCAVSETDSPTVASHGDFANSKLDLTNSCLVSGELRKQLGIQFEAYDNDVARYYQPIISDVEPPAFWRPGPPADIVSNNDAANHVIRILLHPKQWRRSFYWNTRQNLQRALEGLVWYFSGKHS